MIEECGVSLSNTPNASLSKFKDEPYRCSWHVVILSLLLFSADLSVAYTPTLTVQVNLGGWVRR